MDDLKPVRLKALKAQAAFLLKNLTNGNNPDLSFQSVKRFLQLPFFSCKSAQWLLANAGSVQLKHSFMVIAFEYGFKNWSDLSNAVIKNDCLYRPCCVAYIYRWFKNYDDAETYFNQHGGYLLRFWKDYVVCGQEYITCLGLNNCENLWESIGNNWVKPRNIEAFNKLFKIAKATYKSQN